MPKPTTYRKKYCKMLIDHMSQGLSFETFGAEINKTKSTLYEWVKHHPEFAEAKEIAFTKAQVFFEKRLVAKVSGSTKKVVNFDARKVDTSTLLFALKTRFHKTYGEKKEDDTSTTTININTYGNEVDL